MVQLKVAIPFQSPCFPDISIPYGSIKSKLPGLSQEFKNSFQFLMVQLKASYDGGMARTDRRFQFLMVQLKGKQDGMQRWI